VAQLGLGESAVSERSGVGGRRALGIGLAVAAICCLLAGVWVAAPWRSGGDGAPPDAFGAATVPAPPGSTTGTLPTGLPVGLPTGTAAYGTAAPSVSLNPPLTVPPAARVVPTSLDIPAIGVRTPLVDLHLGAAGELVPPIDFGVAGWYAGGTAPGQPGPAVLAGHVDSVAGPAVFFRLSELRPGDAVLVHRADGSTLRYVVSATVRYPKARFPTDLVYAPVPDTELRLITCGGTFDRSVRSYRDDVVVSAVAAPS
jgi:Sortase domain